jgi:hypothetical protein
MLHVVGSGSIERSPSPLLGLRRPTGGGWTKEAFKAENNQRRHALNSYWFSGQSASEATGHCYVQVFAIKDGGPPRPDLT